MAKKNKHEEDAGDTPATTDAPEQQTVDNILPPHDPPVVDSPPFPPPAPDAVEDIPQKGAQPEDTAPTAPRELELLQVGTRGEGPAPEPEAPPPPPEGE